MAAKTALDIPLFDMLKEDHDKVLDLFESYEDASEAEQKEIVSTIVRELEIHATLEESIVYPAIRAELDDQSIMNEADEEHRLAKLLVEELKKYKAGKPKFDAKVKVLGDLVKHHAEEEEDEMFSQAKTCDIDWDLLAEKVSKKKAQLMVKKKSMSSSEKKGSK